ncbi:MAG: hypothetical protein A2W22_04285 [Candidatus Levybacteria bacterium RBG_16_35_11]|nr:MAG: hypothetical protein A2W22_04285 [Candidatus Levybacteria bacterium RBG_16_35_11]
MEINVVKANGKTEPFSEEKLRASIRRAGIDTQIENDVVEQIKAGLYENIKTSEIYGQIRQFLGRSPQPMGGSKYSLKQAIMQLGPTGYPFEDFIAEVLEAEGFKTKVRVVLQGKCITHEIDVVAEKEGKKIMVEAKFHNLPGTRTDVHVPLYTKARFDDLREGNELTDALLVTNTKMTEDAIAFANCVGIKLLSWSYPEGESLRELIEKWNIHPITQLDSLSVSQKQQLLQNHCVLCKDIKPDALRILALPENKTKEILEEAEYISNKKS